MADIIKLSDLSIIGSFNCKLQTISLRKQTNANSLNIQFFDTNEVDDLIQTKNILVLKEINLNPMPGDANRNSRVFIDAANEIDFLKNARKDGKNFIVKFIGEFNNVNEQNITIGKSIILEKAQCNLLEMYFEEVDSVYMLKARKQFESADSSKRNSTSENYHVFLKTTCEFFQTVLEYLKSKGIVYCDWKLENILCFHERPSDVPILKLADFGSCQKANVEINHPKNINPIYSSPSFCQECEHRRGSRCC